MATINVDPEKKDDKFYRYKMARVITKVEGNGNGIKTVIVNIEDIARSLGRVVEYPMKFLGNELAATSKFKDEKWILTGAFEQADVQEKIFLFVKRFVLCKSCRNPETILWVDEEKMAHLNCKACSQVSHIDPREKLMNLILKTEQPRRLEVGKKEKKKGKKKNDKTKDEKEELEWDAATRKGTAADAYDDNTEKPNPVLMLKEFISSEPAESLIVGKVFDMKHNYMLSDKNVVQLVFESLFDSTILTANQIPENGKILKRFLKPEVSKVVIDELMALCVEAKEQPDSSLYNKFALALKAFYDNDVLGDDEIIKWHTAKPSRGIDKEAQKFFREKATPLVDWLKDNDEEDEEEDEEDGEGDEDED